MIFGRKARSDMDSISLTLFGDEKEGGYIHLTSPDLPGFHFLCAPGEDVIEAARPTVMEFLSHYLAAKIKAVRPAIRPEQYRARMQPSRKFDLVAEVA